MFRKKSAFAGLVFFLFSCSTFFFITCDLGTQPVGPTVKQNNQVVVIDSNSVAATDSVTKNMRIFVTPSSIPASNTETADVVVYANDDNQNPIQGKIVTFRADTGAGIISSFGVTDSFGRARATYLSFPRNTEARIYAYMQMGDTTLGVIQTIMLKGMQVKIMVNSSNVLKNTVVPVSVMVFDGMFQPTPNAIVTLTGTTALTGKTNSEGIFSTTVTSSSEQAVSLVASARGAVDSATVNFWTTIPDTVSASQVGNLDLRVFSSKTQMRADNSDSAIITVLLTNQANNPQVGQKINFTCTPFGIITQSALVDSNGRATAVLRSEPVNGVCTITATIDGTNNSSSTEILFSGVKLSLATSATDLKTGEFATIEAFIKDGSGNPINGDTVLFHVSNGTFDGGATDLKAAFDPNGKAVAKVTASSAGAVIVSASALNTSDSVAINFTNNTLTLAPSPASIAVGGTQTSTITATYVNGSGNPVANELIVFATNAGTLSADTVRTDALGKAATTLSAGAFTGTATIQANAPNGTAQTTVAFTATAAAQIKLSITPDNIGVNGGVAVLTATVTDSQGNMVNGASVNFRILKGPGGGEAISKPLVVTNNGVAASQLLAGSLASQYRGCLVVATVGAAADTSKLTISGEPYIITVSRPQDDTVSVPKGGLLDLSTFQYNIGAVVQDINGNPVADGTRVHFSAFVSGMAVGTLVLDHWSGIDAANEEKKAVYALKYRDFIFEDINNTKTMDPGIDLMLDDNNTVASRGDDVNGNGTCDYNSTVYDYFWDFNGSGVCEPGVGEPYLVDTRYIEIINMTIVGTDTTLDTVYNYKVYADLNQNGMWDRSELAVDHNGNGICDLPASGDFRFGLWEVRDYLQNMKFDQNDFAVVIAASAETKGGVAYATITYPRQYATRLYGSVNAEANGIRDRDGERFLLPVIVEK